MRILFTFPKDCVIIQAGSTVTVITDKKDMNIPVIVQGTTEAREYIAQAKDINEKVRLHVG